MIVRDRVAGWLVLPAIIAFAAALMLSVALSQPVAAGGSYWDCRTLTGTALRDALRSAGSRVDGGTATLVVPRGLCKVPVSFSSYELPGGFIRPFDEQVLHDNVSSEYGPGRYTINVNLPNCSWQTDLYVGDVITQLDPTYGHPYTKLIDYEYAQGTPCDQGPPDVSITKAASATEVTAGDTFTYTLVVSNTGTGTAQGVTVTDNSLDPPLLLSAPSTTQGSCTAADNNLACDLGDVAAGASVTISFTATTTPDTCPRARNQATVAAANEPVENQANNQSELVSVAVSCETPEPPSASLNVKKVDPEGNPLEGAVFTVDGIDGTWTTGPNGKFCIVGLPDDSLWLVTEIQAPAGYVIGDQPSQMVEVDDDGDCDSASATFVNKPKQQHQDPCKDPNKPWWMKIWCYCRSHDGHDGYKHDAYDGHYDSRSYGSWGGFRFGWYR